MKLTGSQVRQLSEALRQAFTLDELRIMLRTGAEKNLDDISLGPNLGVVVFELIEASERQGWTADLVLAARLANPGNADLLAAAQALGLASTAAPPMQLERIVRETQSFLDPAKWRAQMAAVESQVCRIEIQCGTKMVFGTGFLLAPDVVMTNYHVMEPVILGVQGKATPDGLQATPGDVALRFDYKRLADGTTLNEGTVYRLPPSDWLIDSSPPSPADAEPDPKPTLPRPDELDHALVRLTIGAGDESPPGTLDARGWIQIPATPPALAPESPLTIMQHPEGDPLQMAMDNHSVITTNGNGTRVSYRTNTLGGSSGSPCFDQNWQLAALHHSGDPNFDPAHKPEYNEGIPVATIVALLEERGLVGALTGT